MVRGIRAVEVVEHSSHALPLFDGKISTAVTRRRRAAAKFLKLVLLNKNIASILDRLHCLRPEVWITAGCLVQTVWNVKTGQPAASGIDDYDLIYFDDDISWAAEDAMIKRGNALFADLPIMVQIRNQARVPLWYPEKFGIPYPALRQAPHALLRYPSRTTAIALTRREGAGDVLYAPFGFKDALEMRIRPNQRLPIESVYDTKSARWAKTWPQLDVRPWAAAAARVCSPDGDEIDRREAG